MPDRRRATRMLLALTAAGALAGTFASLAHLAWWLELFSHFRLQYAVMLAACGVALAALRRPGIGLAALALAAVNTLPLVQYFAPSPQPAGPGPELTVVMANVWFRNDDHDRVLHYVTGVAPDVAIFLEATPPWGAALAGLREALPYQAHAGETFVAARKPLSGLRVLPLGDSDSIAVVFAYETGGTPVTVIGAHVNWPLGPGIAASRNRELADLAAIARGAPGPVLLVGDLNVTAFSPAFDALRAGSGLRDCAGGRGLHPTWPAWFPPLWIRIDHCLSGPGLAVTRLASGPWVGSDHFPLEVTVRLTGAGSGVIASQALPTSRR
jgi:endonuclease/exonuclease/phosphatase (EEP) superfamily protein YafD